MAEGDVGVNKNAPPGASPGDKNKNDDLDLLRQQNEELGQQNASMRAEMDDIRSTIISSQRQPAAKPLQPKDDSFNLPKSDDLDMMSRAEFLGVIGKMMDGKLKSGVTARINDVDMKVEKSRLEKGVAEAAGKFPDFANYQREMRLVLSRVGRDGISPTDLYKIASWKASAPAQPRKRVPTNEKPTPSSNAPVSNEKLSMVERMGKVYDQVMEKQGK